MAEGRWQAELVEPKNELQGLRESIALGKPPLYKDLTLITLVPKGSGSDSTVTLEEFLSSIKSAARIARWQDADKQEIADIKLVVSVKLFYQGCAELHKEDAN
jgi:hypothetical protein